MSKDTLVFLKHVKDFCNDISSFVGKATKKDFLDNMMMQDAVVRKIEIIGEAVKNVPHNFREKYPQVPWKKIAGMRDKIIHHYFDVDLDTVWATIQKDIQELKEMAEEIIKKEED